MSFYTIYNAEGKNLEEHIPVESFNTIGQKLGQCLESGLTLALSSGEASGAGNPMLQVVPVTDQDDNQAIMLSFEDADGEFCRFYEQPYTDEKLQEVLQYLHAFCMEGLRPDTDAAGWISASDENTDYRPEIAAFYVDEKNRPYCKSVEGILYLMFDGASPDDYSLMSLEDMGWDVKGLREVDAEKAGKAAALLSLVEDAFLSFWTDDAGEVYAVNHFDMVLRVARETDGQIMLSAMQDMNWQQEWNQISLDEVRRRFQGSDGLGARGE